MITRVARPPANSIARASKSWNCDPYSSALRPRYWLFTPMSSVTTSNGPVGRAPSMPRESSSVVQPVRAMMVGVATLEPRTRSAAASCIGHRSSTETPSPIVYESPRARIRISAAGVAGAAITASRSR
jgi:hypothetical protein